MRKTAGRQYEPNKSRQGGHKHQIPNKFQITISNDQNNQGILSILIAVANRSHENLKGSLVKPGCWAPWWRLLTPLVKLHQKGVVSI